MHGHETVNLKRDVEGSMVPVGEKVTLLKDEEATITQSLGGTYTVIVNGNMFSIAGRDADALGREPELTPAEMAGKAETQEELEKQIWDQMKTVYDPEIPVNIVDLGLIYKCELAELPDGGGNQVDVAMTLTAPGCGMGPTLQQDVQNKILYVEGVDDVNVELVWDPPWNQDMMTDAAKLQLGMM